MDSDIRDPEVQLCPNPVALPLQQVVSSASQLPGSPRKSSTSGHVASPRYVQQYQLLMDHQREVFNEERTLWYTERSELYEKLFKLEASLRNYESICSNQSLHLPENNKNLLPGVSDFTVAGTFKSTTNGDEFWRGAGGKSDAQPTRVFSDSTNQLFKVGNNYPSIAENATLDKPTTFLSADPAVRAAQNWEIHRMRTDKSLDGITFKQNPKISSISQSLMTPQSPSPLLSPSPAHLSPTVKVMSASLLAVPYDPYTKDAGHTPVARRTDYDLDGSGALSGVATPTKPEDERPPLEPHVSMVRPPCERDDSYFPSADENGEVELKEPLTLKNSNLEDQEFLQELDSKLQAAKLETGGLPESSSSEKPNSEGSNQPEPEPRLKIKRSMNFGAPFGSVHYGKRF